MRALLTSTTATGLFALALALLWSSDRAAAEPTEAQVAAIKANCRSDYMSYCWSVPRGGPEAAQCLKKNLAKLSPACQQAVNAATAAAAPAAPAAKAPETPAVPPSPPPAAATAAVPPAASSESAATDPADKVTAPASATDSAPAVTPSAAPVQPETTAKAPAPTAPAAVAPATPAGAAQDAAEEPPSEPATTAAVPPASSEPLGFIPPRKKLILLRACNAELKSFCGDVSYGGGRAIACLQANEAVLTPDCRQALAKVVR